MREEQQDFEGGRLTALLTQKGNPDRISLFIDGKFRFGVFREIAYRHRLKKGIEITTEQLLEIWRDEQVLKARDLAIRYLGQKARTTKQMADYLASKEFEEKVIAKTINWLLEHRYLDDQLYARQWVERRLREKPRGRSMLRWELQQKGIDSAEINCALEDLDSEAQLDAAVRALAKKVGRKQLAFTLEDKRKLAGYLGRRGFPAEIVYAALRRFREGSNLDND
jgi:regulatory protein